MLCVMKVVIVSPEKTLFNGEAIGVIVPGELGYFEILQDHAPIISTLSQGVVVLRGVENFEFPIIGGFVEVAHNEVSLCVELAVQK